MRNSEKLKEELQKLTYTERSKLLQEVNTEAKKEAEKNASSKLKSVLNSVQGKKLTAKYKEFLEKERVVATEIPVVFKITETITIEDYSIDEAYINTEIKLVPSKKTKHQRLLGEFEDYLQDFACDRYDESTSKEAESMLRQLQKEISDWQDELHQVEEANNLPQLSLSDAIILEV